MAINVDENQLKNDIEEFVEQKGWSGFFGLLATISPHKVDQTDLEKYTADLPDYSESAPVSAPIQFEAPNYVNPIQGASIYAEEHIPAVQEDLREQGQQQLVETPIENSIIDQPKTRVLEPTNVAPNPWGDAVTVSPGQLEL